MGKGGGAGRKTHTVGSYDSGANSRGGGSGGRFMPIPPDRDLREELGGVIFGATADTIRECIDGLIFGLPERHMTYVEYIEPGCPIFLFNYTDKKLHGIFEATTCGQLNINPHGWTGGTVAKTRYPAQVRVAWYARCTPLPEAVFKPVIAANYYADRRFLFELDAAQATQLCALFKGQAGGSPARAPAPAAHPARATPAAPPPLPAPPAPPAVAAVTAAPQAPAAASPAQQPAPPKRAPQPAPSAKAAAAAPQSLALAAPAAAAAAGAGQQGAPMFALERTHAAACAALAQADPTVTAVVGEHLQACAATFASLRIEASAAAEARAEAARAKAEAAALRAELEAMRAKVAAAPSVSAPRVGTDAVEMAQPAPLLSSCVFTVGGYDGANWLSTVECYDPQAGTWEPFADMSAPRGSVAAATLPGASVLLVGGGAGATFFDTVEAFDVASGAWRSCAPLSERRGNLAAVTLKDDVYIFGGGYANDTAAMCCVATTERYDAASDAWVRLAPLNFKRFGVAGAVLGGAMYAAGGFDGDSKLYMASAERFDPREGVWRALPPMPGGQRSSLMLAPAPGAAGEHTLIAAGGYYVEGQSVPRYQARVEAYDARANAWRPLNQLKRSRAYGAAVNVDDRLVLMGGLHGKDYAETVDEYDVVTDTWKQLTLVGGACRRFRSFLGATCVRAAI